MTASSQSPTPTYIARIWPGHIEILRSVSSEPRERVELFDIEAGESLRVTLRQHRWRLSGRGFTLRGKPASATVLPVERVRA